MIFKHTIDKVISVEKTQTRRIVKAGQTLRQIENPFGGFNPLCVRAGERTVYAIGKDYAVQADRGKPSVARIRITNLRREDVRQISAEDLQAEGFDSRYKFWQVWQAMHDLAGRFMPSSDLFLHNMDGVELAYYEHLMKRPSELYQAWVLDFELVKGDK